MKEDIKFDCDYATDCFLCDIMKIAKPEMAEYYQPFVSAIGYELPLAERRMQAHKLIQKFLNEFKATNARPMTKPLMLSLGVKPDFADARLTKLNEAIIANGITTEKRLNYFMDYLLKLTDSLQILTNWPGDKSKGKELSDLCEFWKASGCNYFADIDATALISSALGSVIS